MRWSAEIRATVVAMAATLLSYGTALAIEQAEDLSVSVLIVAVVLALTLSRTQRAVPARRRLFGLVVTPVVAVAATEVGRLLFEHPTVGDALFVLALSAAIYVRRFPRLAPIGSYASLPFIAVLITPAPAMAGGGSGAPGPLWAAVIALVACVWVAVTQLGAQRIGFVPRPASTGGASAASPGVQSVASGNDAPRERSAGVKGSNAGAGERRSRVRAAVASANGLPPSTRMALQMAVALGFAFGLGRWIFPDHWPWVVITAYITTAGNRGRGDVVHKAAQRLVGATAGTIAATLFASSIPARHAATVVAIFVVLAVATLLRGVSYGYWAAGVTATLALLYGYFGSTDASLLEHRVEGILVGAAIAVAASWFVLPVRSADVLRRRSATALSALTDLLVAVRRGQPDAATDALARYEDAVKQLDQIAPAFGAHRRTAGRRRAVHPADAIDAFRAARPAAETIALGLELRGTAARLGATTKRVVALRRALGGTEPFEVDEPVVPGGSVDAIVALDTALDAAARALATLPPRR